MSEWGGRSASVGWSTVRTLTEEHKRRMREGRRTARESQKGGNTPSSTLTMCSGTPESILRGVPPKLQNLISAAYRGKASFAKMVKAKCYECCNFEDVPDRIRFCTVRQCPLWARRPFQAKEVASE